MSDFLNEYDDEQWCEIIDVIWNCEQFKKDLIENEQKKIQGELSLKLEELTRLSGHDKIDNLWKDLKTVVKDVIYIEKIKSYMSWISKYGVDWYKEYYDGTTKDEVNPVKLIADVWSNSSEIGFDCSKKETELKEWKGYFDECGEEVKTDNGKNAKVVRVLKSTVKAGRGNERNYYVPIKEGWTSWVSNQPIESSLRRRYSGTISSKGKLGELVVETCDQYQSWLWGIGKDSFCKEILEKFFGDVVKDKRYCLYEMPNSRNLN